MRLGLSLLFYLNKPFKFAIERVSRIGVDRIEIVDEGPHELNEKRVYAIKGYLFMYPS
jgi:hypothetical protein